METEEMKKMITVEYSAVLDSFRTRTVEEMIKDNMDAMCDNRHPLYSLLYIAESKKRADFIIRQIKRGFDTEVQKKEMEEYYIRSKQNEDLSDLTFDQLMNKLNGKG